MFFCEPCKTQNGWPESMSRSRGRCEICGKSSVCYDVPSSRLPARTKLTRVGNPVSEDPGHYVITVSIKAVTPAGSTTRGGVVAERGIEDLLTTTVKAVTLPEAIRRAKAIIDVAASPTT